MFVMDYQVIVAAEGLRDDECHVGGHLSNI